MRYNYQTNCGQFVLHEGDKPIGPCLDTVAIAFDARSHTMHKHGSPESVQTWLTNAKAKLEAVGQLSMAQDLRLLEGAFPVELLNQLLECSGFLPRFLANIYATAGLKPSIDVFLDDEGNPLVHGAMYSVYQEHGSPDSGYLAYWTEHSEWLDADTLEPCDLSGEYGGGRYCFACRQSVPVLDTL